MRIRKYRAKKKYGPERGEWIYATLGEDAIQYGQLNIYFNNTAIDTDTLGEFSGLHTSKGAEVYEGDYDKHGFIIAYVDGSDPATLGMPIGFYAQRDNFESWCQLEVGDKYDIIGSIHDKEGMKNRMGEQK